MKIRPFQLERFFARHEFSAPHLLSSSDCESFSIQDLLAMEPGAHESFLKLGLGYTESLGLPALRAEIARLYQNVTPDQILVHAGAEEAIFNFMNVALEPGDHVIVHSPCYQSLAEVARAIGCEISFWKAEESEGWAPDLNVLEKLFRKNTKLLVINFPHNPTGYLPSRAEQSKIFELAEKKGVTIFSDEVYRYLEYREEDRLPAACDLHENAVSLGVMSKTFGLAGLRIGWIATRNLSVYNSMAEYKDYTTICNSAPSEFLSVLALKNHDQIVRRNRELITKNLSLLDRLFQKHQDKLHWVRPRAGAIGFPCLKSEKDSSDFCEELIRKKGVLLLPSRYFDAGNRNFRLGFGRATLSASLQQFDDFLSSTR